jgi:type II secretory ATPase GspE/PulE/Tfp pilus assembly ATPase PilB-like protein
VQVNVKAGLTFASSLRSILRQDPDVIMVGEIRDKETAEISINAAQTGHLVLSTLHTNDSVGASGLLDIGVPAYQIAAAVTGIVAQRLIRQVRGESRSGDNHPIMLNVKLRHRSV